MTPISAKPVVRATCQRRLRWAISVSRRASSSSTGAVPAGGPGGGGGARGPAISAGLRVGRVRGAAVYPDLATAAVSVSIEGKAGSKETVAVSLARLTEAATTPSTRVSVFSTRLTQDAQVMPPMLRLVSTHSTVWVGLGVVVAVMSVPRSRGCCWVLRLGRAGQEA